MFCSSCGLEYSESSGAKFCHRCGTRLKDADSEDTGTQAGLSIKLSAAAMESFNKLRKMYHPVTETTSFSAKKRKIDPHNLEIGVQILDKKGKSVRKIFPTDGFKLKVQNASTEIDWINLAEKSFKNIKFESRVPSSDGFRKPEKILNTDDLKKIKKERKLHQLRLYLLAVGKDREEIKKAFQPQKEGTKVVDLTKDDGGIEVKEAKGREYVAEDKKEEDDIELPVISTLRKEERTKSQVEPDIMADNEPLEERTESQVEPDIMAVNEQLEERTESQDEPDIMAVNEPLEERTESQDEPDIMAVNEPLEIQDDHDLEKFIRVQNKLVERKQEASKRIKNVERYNQKQFTILYEARNNFALTFKAPIDADIGFLFDMVCHLLEADITAPRFYFKSGDVFFERSNKCSLNEVPSMLQLIEEEFNPDDTITNLDDVIF